MQMVRSVFWALVVLAVFLLGVMMLLVTFPPQANAAGLRPIVVYSVVHKADTLDKQQAAIEAVQYAMVTVQFCPQYRVDVDGIFEEIRRKGVPSDWVVANPGRAEAARLKLVSDLETYPIKAICEAALSVFPDYIKP